MMNNRLRLFLLIVIMTTVSGVVVAISTYRLYQASLQQQEERLIEIVKSRARLIEATFQSQKNSTTVFNTLLDVHQSFQEFGKTGEFILGKRQDNQIIFLLSHQQTTGTHPNSIPWQGHQGEAMRRALLGESGTLIGLDYKGHRVLASYEPIDFALTRKR